MAERNQVDTRVRLSAEGQQEVINAFRQVQREGEKSGRSLANSFSFLGRLLPAISFVAITAGLVAMGKRAAQSADNMGKLQQKTGASIETLSVLSFAAKTADLTQEALNTSLIRLARTLDDYDQGVRTAREAVRGLFGSEKALQGLDTDERFRRILLELGKLEPGARRTGLAVAFLGKQGAEALPLLSDLAEKGFAELTEKAGRFGQLFSQDVVDAVTRANDAMTDMLTVSEGLAIQFVSGLAPALAQTSEAIAEGVAGKGFSAFQKLGEVAGVVIKFIVGGLHTVGQFMAMTFEDIGIVAINVTRLLERLAKGKWKGALDEFRENTNRAMDAVADRMTQNILSFEKRLEAPPPTPSRPRAKAEPSEDTAAAEGARKAAEARLRFEQARLQDELLLARAHSKLLNQEDKLRFDQGLLSLQEFFARRREALQQEGQAELEILNRQAQAVRAQLVEAAKAAPAGETEDARQRRLLDLRGQLAHLENQAEIQRIENQGRLSGLAGEEREAVREFNRERLEAEAQLLAAEGNRFAAARAQLEAQIAGIKRLAGETEAAFQARTARLSAAGEARIAFDELREKARAAMAQLAADRRAIELQAAQGLLTQFEAVARIVALERERLPLLQQISAQLQAAAQALGPEAVEQAREFNSSLQELGDSSEDLESRIRGALTADLTEFFTRGIFEAKSFGDAMKSLALSIVESLQRIAAEMLATWLISKLLGGVLGLFGGGGGGSVFPGAGGDLSGGLGATGGLIRGPGSGTSDSIPMWLSDREFVVRSGVVKQPGMARFLRELNAHGWPALNLVQPRSHFAEGGLVDAMGGLDLSGGRGEPGARGRIDALFELDEAIVLKRIAANPEFDKVVVRVLERNRKSANQALGQGVF